MEHIQDDIPKKHTLFIVLSTLFITNALIAEVIGAKILSVEKILNIPALALPFIGDSKLNLEMSVGVLIWPIVFILSDIINEYFGKSGVKRISIIGAAMIAYAFFIVFLSTKTPPADFWLQNNALDPDGNSVNINHAYTTIFRQGLGIIIGSITAFLVGQLVDAYTFHYLRVLTQHKWLWLRATGSTVVSQLVDSFLILFIAFYLLGNWSMNQVIAVGLIQYLYKIILAIILTPVIYLMHSIIDKYLGRKASLKLIAEAKDL
ncbi:MAG TPA: queuosine precursor transporter [Tenuifilaceae bacterium]|nr:queuosine precursor transporter [Tenuifilaceae bacterium]HPI44001.1 queuosine precursor transporter [Tenuifilaceae bacterium]HPN21303.1 queuosine precursor transporter [Tenuifilaceae bacterium]